MKLKKILLGIGLIGSLLVGCSSENTEKTSNQNIENQSTSINEVSSENETDEEKKISVASVSISQILAEINVDIVGRPTTNMTTLPQKYENVAEIGSSFSPDFEKVLAVGTELLIGDSTFKDKIETSAKEYGIETFYVTTSTYSDFLKSIAELGEKIGKQEEATKIIEKFKEPLSNIDSINKNLKVAIIFGSSESNMLATENTYIGSLVNAFGVKNIANEIMSTEETSITSQGNAHSTSGSGYINLNVEQLLKNQPDIILAFAHGSVEENTKAIEKLFSENPAWKNLNAVKDGKVYYLDSTIFGTSANNFMDKALIKLGEIFNEN